MKRSNKILNYVFMDLVRSKLFTGYTLLLLVIGSGVVYIGRDDAKAIASLLNVVLLIVPLVSIVFGTIYFYNSMEFMELLLTQPVRRSSIFKAEFYGVSFVLSLSFLIGIGIPLFTIGISIISSLLLLSGVVLTFIFVGISYLISVVDKDKTRSVAYSLIIWLFLSIIYDGMILILSFIFIDYPIENLVLVLTAFNPIDLTRILIILNLDLSALMGFTGASFDKLFGDFKGVTIASVMLLLWVFIPCTLALKKYKKRDF